LDLLIYFVIHKKANVSFESDYPLRCAVSNGQLEMVQWLVDVGKANPDSYGSGGGNSLDLALSGDHAYTMDTIMRFTIPPSLPFFLAIFH